MGGLPACELAEGITTPPVEHQLVMKCYSGTGNWTSGSGWRPVAGSCERGNGPKGSLKSRDLLTS
jgi:hypothetical protein